MRSMEFLTLCMMLFWLRHPGRIVKLVRRINEKLNNIAITRFQ